MNMCILGLVRATAMNASRAKRAMMSHYQTYYEERAKSLDSIIDKFKHQTTFEEYISNVYSPNGGGSCIIGGSVASVTRYPELKVLDENFMTIDQAMCVPKTTLCGNNCIAQEYLQDFVREQKRNGFIRRWLNSNGQHNVTVAD